jgi:hypothetical protein
VSLIGRERPRRGLVGMSALSRTQQGVLFGVPATGKSLRFTPCDIFRVAGCKIAEHWGMGDIAGVLAQIKGRDIAMVATQVNLEEIAAIA